MYFPIFEDLQDGHDDVFLANTATKNMAYPNKALLCGCENLAVVPSGYNFYSRELNGIKLLHLKPS